MVQSYEETRNSKAKFMQSIEHETMEELQKMRSELKMQLLKANTNMAKLQNPYMEKLNVKQIKANIARIDTWIRKRKTT